MTFLLDAAGALLTLVALLFLLLGGYLGALALLGRGARRDLLATALLSLLLATGEAIAIALVLGGVGALRLDLALAAQVLLVLALLVRLRREWPERELATVALAAARRAGEIARAHPAASILVLHGIGVEALRGLLRPPMSWDALSYHLVLAGAWLQRHDLLPVLGPAPLNYFGYVPANGSLWFWWWMAPAHAEIYVNLAALAHWLLLGLAAGGVARELGARRRWPLAACLTWLVPAVVRYGATEYVDLLLNGCLLAAVFFAIRWLRAPRWSDAVALGIGTGIAAGTKVLGLPYAAALGVALLLLAGGEWRRRLPQLVAAGALVLLLGTYFYLRDVALGAGPLAARCEETARGPQYARDDIAFPRRSSVLDQWGELWRSGQLVEALLGTTRANWAELGFGPQAPLLLLAALALPFATRDRRAGWLAAFLVLVESVLWLGLPFARAHHVYGNLRYALSAVGLAFAGGVAWCEDRLSAAALEAMVVVLLAQDLLQANARMPFGVRLAIMTLDLLAVALLLLPRLRAGARSAWRPLAVAALVAAVLAAPALVAFRVADRDRALASDYTVHLTAARFYAAGWAWLDAHAPAGAVDEVQAPSTILPYPAMGPRFERELRYVNVSAADHALAAQFPRCDPRAAPDAAAWSRNFARAGVRWLHAGRFPGLDWPLEVRFADARPDLFALRFADPTNRVYELLPAAGAAP